MRLVITKTDGNYYSMRVEGNRGSELAPRRGPGHGALVPHDVAHLLAEIELNLAGGVFGRVARAKSTWFPLTDSAEQSRRTRRLKNWTPSPQDRADMARSEEMASIGEVLAARRMNGMCELPDWFGRLPKGIEQDPEVTRVVDRFVDFAERWRDLPPGESMVVEWPNAPRP